MVALVAALFSGTLHSNAIGEAGRRALSVSASIALNNNRIRGVDGKFAGATVVFGGCRSANRVPKHSVQTFASNGSTPGDFNLSEYLEAQVENVRHTDKYGHVIFLKLKDGQDSVLPVYIGDFECAALMKEINKRQATRPMTHDLMKNTLELLGFRVTKVRVNALVGNTYHARVHYTKARGSKEEGFDEVDIDARPSDAINLAVRFGAPIYVNKEVATKMASSIQPYEREESHSEIQRSCREEIMHFHDPTVLYKLQLQVAIAEERYDDAAMLRDRIDRLLASDRALSLVVAIETALDDQRFEEAARLRDEFRRLCADRVGQEEPAKEVQDIQ